MGKNIAYFFYNNAGSTQWRDGSSMPEICLGSLRRNNPTCEICMAACNISDREAAMLLNKYDVNIMKVDSKNIGEMNPFRMGKLREIEKKAGDNILALDLDLFFKEDPFLIFRRDFDVFVTSRYYSHPFPVNSGVWGMKWNERSERFLDFYIDQICHRTTWQPLIAWRNEFKHIFGGWYSDQDFLCVLLLIDQLAKHGEVKIPWTINKRLLELFREEKVPIERLRIMDAGPKYNYASSGGGGARRIMADYFQQIYFGDAKIVHLKHILHAEKWLSRLGFIGRRGLLFYIWYLYCGMRYWAGKIWLLVTA